LDKATRGFRHLAGMEVSDERVHDSQKAIELLEGVARASKGMGSEVKDLIADSGYDTHDLLCMPMIWSHA